MKYNMKAFTKKKGRIFVPVIPTPPGVERSALAQLRKLEHTAATGFREIILPAYERQKIIPDAALGLVRDADSTAFAGFRRLMTSMALSVTDAIASLLKLEGRRHTKAWMKAAQKAFGVDISAVVKEEDLDDYLEQAGLRWAGLIQGLSDDLVKWVQVATQDALIQGKSTKTLQAAIRDRLGVADSRARLIARDQVAKLNSDLTRRRHQDAGLDDYIWRTSQDERVRSRHKKLEGNKYRYGEPTGAEEGLPPGQPIQCRCVAQPYVDW